MFVEALHGDPSQTEQPSRHGAEKVVSVFRLYLPFCQPSVALEQDLEGIGDGAFGELQSRIQGVQSLENRMVALYEVWVGAGFGGCGIVIVANEGSGLRYRKQGLCESLGPPREALSGSHLLQPKPLRAVRRMCQCAESDNLGWEWTDTYSMQHVCNMHAHMQHGNKPQHAHIQHAT
eukprot:6920998-Alexandrium_andersonii.AAC.1